MDDKVSFAVCDLIRQFKPDILNDPNRFAIPLPVHHDGVIKPDIYLDISAVSEKWLEACDAYPMWRGQTEFFRYNDYYRSLAVMRGCLSGFSQAVALMSDPGRRVSRLRTLAPA